MKHNFLYQKVSLSKKALTAVLVVGVLLTSALVINSIQHNPNLQAQVGSLSRLLSNIVGTRLEPLKRIPKDNATLASEIGDGNAIFQSENGELVFDINNIEGIKNASTDVGQDGTVTLPSDPDPLGTNSYIVTFKADSIVEKTKDVLNSRGTKILPGEKNKESLTKEIQKIKPQIDTQKATITSQQNAFIAKINTKFGNPKEVVGNSKSYRTTSGKEVEIRQLKTAINAVTIQNVTEAEIEQLTQGVSNIKSIEKARTVKVDLTDTPDIINSSDIQQYIGANGVPLTGQGTIIGIVDTGVDYTHQDLGSCSFLLEGGCKVAYGYDFINDDPDPMDDHGHGTHVAATAAGNGYYTESNGNTHPLLGIAPDATIYAFKVLSASGSGSNLAVIAGIEACVDPNGDGDISDRVTVCSLSLGSPNGNPLDADALAADAAVDAGVIMTIAAGNSGPGNETIGSPGTSRKAITVGAACKPDEVGSTSGTCSSPVASFSSRGPVYFTDENNVEQILNKPDIVSPGVNICAAQWGSWMENKSCLGDGEHIAISGTSMATPTVAGLMALLAQAHPEKTVAELKSILMTTATDLGLPVNVQGQGLVDGLSALEGLGMPNAMLSIEGLPFNIEDIETTQTATYTKELTLENISNQPLNLTATRVSSNQGINISFPENISIPTGQDIEFPVTVTIDHTQAVSGLNIKETIRLSNGSDSVNVVLSIRIPQYINTSAESINLGLYHESQPTFSSSAPVTITNRMTNQSVTYDIVADESLIQTSYQDNISVIPSVNQITINPGESRTLNISLSAFSNTTNLLPNKSYKIPVKFVSSTESVSVDVEFFKGYSFELFYGSNLPEFILISNATSTWQQSYEPNPQADSLILKTSSPGPFHAVATYMGEDDDFDVITTIFQHDIGLEGTPGVVTYDLSKNKAEHRIENNYSGNSCRLRFIPDTGLWGEGISMSGGGRIAIEYNSVPENMHFSLMCGDLMPDNKRILFSQIYLTEGLNQDFSLNDDTADISTRYMYGFDNKKGENNLTIGINLCNFRDFRKFGLVDSSYSSCSLYQNEGGDTIVLNEGETGVIEVRSLHTDTPETADVPSYPAFKIHGVSGTGEDSDYFMYSSPEMFATSEKLYAWTPFTSGYLTTSETAGNAYEKTKVNVVNDNFITVGTGPIVDTSLLRAFQDDFGFLSGFASSFVSMYQYADGSTESFMNGNPNPTKGNIQLFRNGTLTHSKIVDLDLMFKNILAGIVIPDEEGDISGNSYGGPVVGSYLAKVSRIGKFNGEEQNGVFDSEFSFSISENTIDSIPPSIRNIQLVSDGILQNHFDIQSPGVLNLYVEPGYGIQSHSLTANSNGAYNITYMPDSISNIAVYSGDSYSQLVLLPTPQLVDGKYVVDLSTITSAAGEYKYFKIVATDSNGNTTTYKFVIEVGESLDVEEITEETLFVCVKNNPIVTFSPQTPTVIAGAPYTHFDVTFVNQNSLPCDPETYSVTLATKKYPPLYGAPNAIRITNTYNPPNPNWQTTQINVTAGGLVSGATVTKTVTVRADAGLVDGHYQVGSTLVRGFGAPGDEIISELPFYIDVGSGDGGSEPVCTANTTSVTLNPAQPTIDSGGPTASFGFTITNNDSTPCAPSNFTLSFDTDQFSGSVSGTKKIRGSATSGSSFTTTEFSVASGSLNPGQSYTGTGYLRTDMYFPNGTYQIGATLTDTTNNQTQTVPVNVVVSGAETEPVCTANTTSVTLNPAQPTIDSGGPTASFGFTITNNDSTPCAPSNFTLSFDTDQFSGSVSGTKKIRGSATSGSSFTTTEFSVASGSLNPGQSYTGTGYLRTDMYFPNGTYQIGATLTDTTNNQTQTVPVNVVVSGAETETPSGTCVRNPVTVTPIGLIASHPNTETSTKGYQLSITNNDTVGCPNSTIKVLITDTLDGFGLGKSNFVQQSHNKFDHSWSLAPGQTQVKNVFYRNFGSIIDQSVSLLIQVTDITQSSVGSTHTPINLNGSINYGNPQ